jgi:tetratricopeptide (TPR) repeat protein/predicted Ser/Thr protein kinase
MPDRAERLAELVKSAIDRPPDERGAFLDKECESDPAMRAEIESLLEQQDGASRFIEEPALHVAAESLVRGGAFRAGQTIGEYEIISLIGSGGMGEVYLAQDRQLHRKVALKLIRRGMDSDDIVHHFKREEHLLASLNHPNISQLYGGGVTSGGIPFFAMEYVEGKRLDEYCDERVLGTKERLQLFRKVCAAVTYAHQHLVIHRDLKPANIRVTPEGEPKLLDFGIAKLVDSDNAQSSGQTVTLQGVMTPEYASPEQVRGETMTTTSDVYSLGVVLYKLLTGQSPYRTKTNRPDEIARAITEQEPTRPSTAVGLSGNHQSEIRNLKSLRGDLDNIILMALRKEPQRRYASVGQFSADIQRHLDGLPVIARKDTFKYRAAKFVGRNKLGVAAVALVSVTLFGGIIATFTQARRAEQQRARAEKRFNDVRELANSFVFEINQAIENLPGAIPARVLLVKRALKYLDSLARESGGDRSLQRELAVAYLKIGDIQGRPYRANIGDAAGALVSYRKAQTILEDLTHAEPKNLATLYELSTAYENIGRLQTVERNETEAVESARKAVAIAEQLMAAEPATVKYRKLLGDTYTHLGMAMFVWESNLSLDVENLRHALDVFRKALSIHEALAAVKPSEGTYQWAVGADYQYIGAVQGKIADLTGDSENYRLALESHWKELEINQALSASDLTNASYRELVATAHIDIGNSQMKMGDAAHAIEHFRQSRSICESLAASDPSNVEVRSWVAYNNKAIGKALAQTGDTNGALAQSEEALAGFTKLLAGEPTNIAVHTALVGTREQIGGILEKGGKTDAALESYGKALALLHDWLALRPASAEARHLMALDYVTIGKVYQNRAAGRKSADESRQAVREARASFQRSLEIWQEMRDEGQLNAADATNVDRVSKDIAECNTALGE